MFFLLIFVLVVLNAFFAAGESVSANKAGLKRLQVSGNKKNSALIKLAGDSGNLLTASRTGITLTGYFAVAIATAVLLPDLAQFFPRAHLPAVLFYPLGLAVIALSISYLTLVGQEAVRQKLALGSSLKTAARVVGLLVFFAKTVSPFICLLKASTKLVLKVFGSTPPEKNDEIPPEELRQYLTKDKNLAPEEKEIIEAVLDFKDQVVRRLMVPRTDILYINAGHKIEEALAKACQSKYSQFPVYRQDYDDIIGMVRIHDLACRQVINGDREVANIMTPVLFVPETKNTIKLLKELRQNDFEMAIVVDEYGGTAGLVTLEDLVDEIIGGVPQDEEHTSKVSEDAWIIEGDTPIQEITELLDLKEIPPDPDYDTIAGFLLEKLGHLPVEGETIIWEGYRFTIKKMGVRRIQKVLIARIKHE